MQRALKFCKSYAVFYNFYLGKVTEQDKIFRAGDAQLEGMISHFLSYSFLSDKIPHKTSSAQYTTSDLPAAQGCPKKKKKTASASHIYKKKQILHHKPFSHAELVYNYLIAFCSVCPSCTSG